MRVFVLGSGSSGNALLVESCGTRVLVEAGIGPKVVASRLLELGLELRPGELHGIVATHHHGDHFGHADKLAIAFAAPLYLHGGIPEPVGRGRGRRPDPDPVDVAPDSGIPVRSALATEEAAQTTEPIDVRRYEVGCALRIGTLTITTVQVPHDAAQVAIRVDDGSRAFGVATDVGRVTSGLVSLLAECDAALVEANHCTEMLAFSEYPDVVKRRVGGGWGHLSNAQTAELAARLVGSRVARLWLGHLSRSNNTPARALEVVAGRAKRIDVEVIPATSAVALDVRSTKPHQLGLPF
jgi:phosphoribosyl 1,2-cyclic phosphodiesterase